MASKQNSHELGSLTFEKYMKSVKILHIAMCLGSILIMVLLLNMIGFEKITENDINYSITGIGLIGIISFALIGKTITDKRNKSVKSSDALSFKLNTYRTNKVLRFATIEGPALTCSILGFILVDFSFFLIAFLTIIYLISLKPSENEILEKMSITSNDKKYFKGNMTLNEFEKNHRLDS